MTITDKLQNLNHDIEGLPGQHSQFLRCLLSHLNHQSQPSQKVENWKSSSHLFDQSPRLNMCSGGSAQFSHKFSKRWEEQTSGRGGSTNYLGKLVLHLFSSMIYMICCFMWMFLVRLSICPHLQISKSWEIC